MLKAGGDVSDEYIEPTGSENMTIDRQAHHCILASLGITQVSRLHLGKGADTNVTGSECLLG